MATLTVQQPGRAGAEFTTASAAGGGDQFANDGNTLFYVNNGSGGAITVTIDPAGTPGGLTLADLTATVPDGEAWFIGPFEPRYFNNSNGRVAVTYSGVTSVTVAALRA